MALSKHRAREEAVVAAKGLVKAVARYAETLKTRIPWIDKHKEVLCALKLLLEISEFVVRNHTTTAI